MARPRKRTTPLTEEQRRRALGTLEAWLRLLGVLADTIRGTSVAMGPAVLRYLGLPSRPEFAGFTATLGGKDDHLLRRRDEVLAATLELLRPRGGAERSVRTLRNIHIEDAAELVEQLLDEPDLRTDPGRRDWVVAAVRQGIVPAILHAREWNSVLSRDPLEEGDRNAAQLEHEVWDLLVKERSGSRGTPSGVIAVLETLLFDLGDRQIKRIVRGRFKARGTRKGT